MTVGVLGRAAGLALCMVVVLSTAAAAATPPVAPDAADVDRYLADSREVTRIPGMAVAIVRGGEVVHAAGYGTDGRGDPVTPQTPFRVGSLTKSFTAAAVLQLADEGRIALDAPVQDYLPASGVSSRITVRHLLNQTGGLADSAVPSLNDSGQDLAQRVASLRDARLVSEPGREFHYTDVNYQVLARLIEVVSGQPWAAHLAERVFALLGTTDTVAGATAA
jgi:CubicO group peptidase (beta-lactamase class C family)